MAVDREAVAAQAADEYVRAATESFEGVTFRAEAGTDEISDGVPLKFVHEEGWEFVLEGVVGVDGIAKEGISSRPCN